MQTDHDGRSDFDFLIGGWKIHNQRLRERLKGCDSWEDFESKASARKILGGLGNMDEVTMERESGRVLGITIRFYNPESRQWSLYWADSITGILQIPVIGEFKNGRGEFYSQEPFEGRSVFARFIWSEIAENSCRWEQAFSTDGGQTWETNWIMQFERV